jgi:hypothetical protein
LSSFFGFLFLLPRTFPSTNTIRSIQNSKYYVGTRGTHTNTSTSHRKLCRCFVTDPERYDSAPNATLLPANANKHTPFYDGWHSVFASWLGKGMLDTNQSYRRHFMPPFRLSTSLSCLLFPAYQIADRHSLVARFLPIAAKDSQY